MRHVFERRLSLFPVSFADAAGPGGVAGLRMNATLGDYPRSVADGSLMGWQLLSYRKPTLASSTLEDLVNNTDYGPPNAVDEDIRTWWSASSGGAGEWLTVDLGVVSTVHAVQLNFAEQGSTALGRLPVSDACRYYVEASTGDGDDWHVLPSLDRREPAVVRDAPHDYVELPTPTQMRHVRITSVHVPADALFSLSGLRIFGFASAAIPPPPVGGIAVDRRADDPRHATVRWSPATDGSLVDLYLVRYGPANAESEAGLHHCFQVPGNETSAQINALSVGVGYSFTVDSVNGRARTVRDQAELVFLFA